MPLIAHNDLPTYKRLMDEGRSVLPEGRAAAQDIREMHIGLLNLMQDGALEATERQFFRLIGESNQIAQFYVHLFTLPQIERGSEAQAHIDRYYESFSDLKEQGLDALIVTGLNAQGPELSELPLWESLIEVFDWAWENVTSTVTACLATHAVMEFRYGQKRRPLPKKRWGVYKSRVRQRAHPIVQGMNTVFDVPHSRWNDISWEQFEAAGMKILVNSFEGGVHCATSPDGFRLLCFQGHQEYDTISLLKEFRRDAELYFKGERPAFPPYPDHYFTSEALVVLEDWKTKSLKAGKFLPFPEDQLEPLIENTWRDSAKAIIGNWIGKVYQLTHMDRRKPFMDGVNPNNPLNL
ncbi:MAG: homoserine O-succinyltransferase [Alphaproteobacteria bacterium]|nr:homoserine O-succinyltransferase [Alphaproteobacteria bacterium]